jgi:hypothetical protein
MFAGGSDDEAACISQDNEVLKGTRCGQEQPERTRMMSAYPIEKDSRSSNRERTVGLRGNTVLDEWVEVAVHIEAELSLVQLCQDGEQKMLYSEDIGAVLEAAMDSDGSALWCEKYSKLLIPSTRPGAGNRFFSLRRMLNDDGGPRDCS